MTAAGESEGEGAGAAGHGAGMTAAGQGADVRPGVRAAEQGPGVTVAGQGAGVTAAQGPGVTVGRRGDSLASLGRGFPSLGAVPESRRQALTRLVWISIWALYIKAPFGDLTSGRHGTWQTVLGSAGLAAFVLCYLTLVFFRTREPEPATWVYAALVMLGVLASALSAVLGSPWLELFVYVAVACGAALPMRVSVWAIPASSVILLALGLAVETVPERAPALLLSSLMGGFSMAGVKSMVSTMRELREARENAAHLAATEERLRLARDLHDLLGHSLSLITLKSELAGRMLPDRPQEAAAQVADIERVSRQALIDVREAVTGYRRTTLAVELAAARGALRTAGIEPHTDIAPVADVPADAEGALAWALREAVTNVVRHSGATRCDIAFTRTADGALSLTVRDDGRGPEAGGGRSGNGLTGLEERLLLTGGSLDLTGTPGRGFTLHARVPLRDEKSPSGPRRVHP